MALRVCSYVPYVRGGEPVGGGDEVVVEGPIDIEDIVQSGITKSTDTQGRVGWGTVVVTEEDGRMCKAGSGKRGRVERGKTGCA